MSAEKESQDICSHKYSDGAKENRYTNGHSTEGRRKDLNYADIKESYATIVRRYEAREADHKDHSIGDMGK